MEVQDANLLDLECLTIRKGSDWIDGSSPELFLAHCKFLKEKLEVSRFDNDFDNTTNFLVCMFLGLILEDGQELDEDDIPEVDEIKDVVSYLLSKVSVLAYRILAEGDYDLEDMTDVISVLNMDQKYLVDHLESDLVTDEERDMVDAIVKLTSTLLAYINFMESPDVSIVDICRLNLDQAVLCCRGLKLENTMHFAKLAIMFLLKEDGEIIFSMDDMYNEDMPDPVSLN